MEVKIPDRGLHVCSTNIESDGCLRIARFAYVIFVPNPKATPVEMTMNFIAFCGYCRPQSSGWGTPLTIEEAYILMLLEA